MDSGVLSEFQTGIGAVTHATLDIEQHISHTRTALVDTVASLQGADGGVMAASKVHELLANIHEIVGNAVSKSVGIIANILTYYFNTASRQQC